MRGGRVRVHVPGVNLKSPGRQDSLKDVIRLAGAPDSIATSAPFVYGGVRFSLDNLTKMEYIPK